MSNPVPQCTHIKTNGKVCGSPAVSGTELCYHHSSLKTALAKPNGRKPNGGFAPIPFVFPEDRAAIQINFFLLLQAFNERHIDIRVFKVMVSILKATAKNLGKTGSLVDEKEQESSEPTSQKRDVGHPPSQGSGKSSGLDISAGSLAPENCFSNSPRVKANDKDLFRISTLDLAGHGLQQAAQPLTR